MQFYEYRLTSPALCLGERLKAGQFRPCDTRTVRYSAITGALRERFSAPDLVHAAGYMVEDAAAVRYWTYSPQDRGSGVSKLPLTVQYLAHAEARIYLVANGLAAPQSLEFSLGALKSQGFGRCRMELLGVVGPPTVRGLLRTRLPEDRAELFAVSAVQPRYGYLFRPTSRTDGIYVRSLFEDSFVEGPACLVKEVSRE